MDPDVMLQGLVDSKPRTLALSRRALDIRPASSSPPAPPLHAPRAAAIHITTTHEILRFIGVSSKILGRANGCAFSDAVAIAVRRHLCELVLGLADGRRSSGAALGYVLLAFPRPEKAGHPFSRHACTAARSTAFLRRRTWRISRCCSRTPTGRRRCFPSSWSA